MHALGIALPVYTTHWVTPDLDKHKVQMIPYASSGYT